MSLYRQVSVRIWSDEKFMALSRPLRYAFLGLLTGPYTGPIPGLFVMTNERFAKQLGVGIRLSAQYVPQLVKGGFCSYDKKSSLMYLEKAKCHNPPHNPNVCKGWGKAFVELPECELRNKALADFEAFLGGEPFPKQFLESFRDGYRNGYRNSISISTSIKDSVNGSRERAAPRARPRPTAMTPEEEYWAQHPEPWRRHYPEAWDLEAIERLRAKRASP